MRVKFEVVSVEPAEGGERINFHGHGTEAENSFSAGAAPAEAAYTIIVKNPAMLGTFAIGQKYSGVLALEPETAAAPAEPPADPGTEGGTPD